MGQAPCEIIDGDRGKNYPKQHQFMTNGYCVFLNAGNITAQGFDFSTTQFISKERDGLLRKGRLQRGDVVLTTRGTVGKVAFFGKNIPYDVIRINSGMVIIRLNGEVFDPEFFMLLLRSPMFLEQTISARTGSAQQQLPIRDLTKLFIPVPPLGHA